MGGCTSVDVSPEFGGCRIPNRQPHTIAKLFRWRCRCAFRGCIDNLRHAGLRDHIRGRGCHDHITNLLQYTSSYTAFSDFSGRDLDDLQKRHFGCTGRETEMSSTGCFRFTGWNGGFGPPRGAALRLAEPSLNYQLVRKRQQRNLRSLVNRGHAFTNNIPILNPRCCL